MRALSFRQTGCLKRNMHVAVYGYALRIVDNRRMHDSRHIHPLMAHRTAVIVMMMADTLIIMMPVIMVMDMTLLVPVMLPMAVVMVFVVMMVMLVVMPMVPMAMPATVVVVSQSRHGQTNQGNRNQYALQYIHGFLRNNDDALPSYP